MTVTAQVGPSKYLGIHMDDLLKWNIHVVMVLSF